jgi:Cthe_2314-like HEPN
LRPLSISRIFEDMSELPKANSEIPASVVSPYFESLIAHLRNDEGGRDRLGSESVVSGQFEDVVNVSSEIDRVHGEICLALKAFEEGLFSNVLTVEQIILALKLYLISWATLLDMVASLINKILDLRLADRDITFERVVGHKRVVNSELSETVKQYDEIEVKDFKHHRNEIVHRGKILDIEIEAARANRNALYSRRHPAFLFPNETRISEEEYKMESAEQTKQLVELASKKKSFTEAIIAARF